MFWLGVLVGAAVTVIVLIILLLFLYQIGQAR